MVLCRKLKEELPGMTFKPFTDDFGQELYDNVSQQAWQMWLQESPRIINTYQLDLGSPAGREFLRQQMRIFFEFATGDLAETAWTPPPADADDSR
jgi:Fe-S cluster biosynthesis and repair protein YggX